MHNLKGFLGVLCGLVMIIAIEFLLIWTEEAEKARKEKEKRADKNYLATVAASILVVEINYYLGKRVKGNVFEAADIATLELARVVSGDEENKEQLWRVLKFLRARARQQGVPQFGK